jgi:hypothetical protein
LSVTAAITAAICVTACGSLDDVSATYNGNAEAATAENTTAPAAESGAATAESSAAETPASGAATTANSSGRRSYRTALKGDGTDTATVMVYMCGANLESEDGAATADMKEMLDADLNDNVNVIVETGGADSWDNDWVDPDTNQYWSLKNGKHTELEDIGSQNMADGATLTNFIQYASKNFPADRYILVLWDHGGGTAEGCIWDERYSDDDSITLTELNQSLADSGVNFDIVGFDACLMGTAETAFMLEKYSDYMVASQLSEPGMGWSYTPWLNTLASNPSISSADLGNEMVNSYIADAGDYGDTDYGMSVTDLTYIPELFERIDTLFQNEKGELASGGYSQTVRGITGGRSSDTDDYGLVDLSALVATMDDGADVQSALDQCVVYNDSTVDGFSGLSIYFPYYDLSMVDDVLGVYNAIGIGQDYQDFIKAFASIEVGGQQYYDGGNDGPEQDWFGDDYDSSEDEDSDDDWSDYLNSDWYDDSYSDDYSYDDSDGSLGDGDLPIEEKGDGYVLSLSDEDWDSITDISQWVYLDDGEGYIELGSDDVYNFDDDGDLQIDFDNTWVSLDGQNVCYYYEDSGDTDDGGWYSTGYVPCEIDGKDAQIVLRWDDDHPDGYVAGWRSTEGVGSQKGLFSLKDGMQIKFLCDYYDYDGNYDDQYYWGDLTVDGDITVSYEDVGDGDCLVYYELDDLYQNSYWTEDVLYTMDN